MAKFPLECRVVTAEWPQWREFGKGGKKLFLVEGDHARKPVAEQHQGICSSDSTKSTGKLVADDENPF